MIFILLCLAIVLALQFIPVSYSLISSLNLGIAKEWGVLILSGFFYLSTKPRFAFKQTSLMMQTFWLPMLIALVFGLLYPPTQSPLLWYLLIIPISEELLFRGWYFSIASRVLPISKVIWVSALAFSIWHLQNYSMGLVFLAFQFVYTFFVGLWLGYVRSKSENVFLCIAFHVALNTVKSNFLSR
jgi:membrane protease YdiL (CAAX protease family)